MQFKGLILAAAAGLGTSGLACAQILHDNGGLITTPNPACIPVGGFASQLQSAGGFPNGTFGIGHQLSANANNRVADDFVISDPTGWTITTIDFFAYQTNATGTISPVTAINVQIWNAMPGSPGAQVVFGDTSTNRLSSTGFLNTFRVGSACTTTRSMFRGTATLNANLGPGTYWLDWQSVGNAQLTGPWTPLVTVQGLRGKPGANGVQFESIIGNWAAILDVGPSPEFLSPPVAQDMPFVIRGTVNLGTCYANCDDSTLAPVLTANDFQCFLDRFAAGSSLANCDQSTTQPTLTANDFQCFLNAFAAGCS